MASITQIATLAGALAEQNIMVWAYGGMVLGLVGMVVEFIMWYARDAAHSSDDV